jgi:hypothetical protein
MEKLRVDFALAGPIAKVDAAWLRLLSTPLLSASPFVLLAKFFPCVFLANGFPGSSEG